MTNQRKLNQVQNMIMANINKLEKNIWKWEKQLKTKN